MMIFEALACMLSIFVSVKLEAWDQIGDAYSTIGLIMNIACAYLPTLERQNNGDFINSIFWLCMQFKTTISIQITDKKMYGK